MDRMGELLSGAEGIAPYDPTFREKAKMYLSEVLGLSPRVASGIMGSEMDPNQGIAGMGLADFVPGINAGMGLQEGKRALDQGRNVDAALAGGSAMLDAVPVVGGAAKMAGKKVGPEIARLLTEESGAVGKKAAKKPTDLPSLRGLPAEEAVRIARREPHLIEAGDRSQGLYVGGPRDFKTRQDLTTARRRADKAVEKGAAGGDWYDRYRDAVTEVTSNPRDATWMTKIEGQYSAGVDPGSELGFSIKDTNSAIAFGDPVKAARPAQQAASRRAIAANDPSKFQLGPKTGEYARRIDPATQERTATGVNDRRHFGNLGFRETSGEMQKNALGPASHRYADYETALMVDRANKKNLAGRSDWTGEQIQAAPWVSQKAEDLLDGKPKPGKNGKMVRKGGSRARWTQDAKRDLRNAGIKNPTPEQVEERVQAIAFEAANRQIGDFFPKHTAYGMHEAQPYGKSGHLPGLASASPEERAAFAADPRQGWLDEKGRDSLYAGMRLGDTGYAMRTRPSTRAQGFYEPPDAPVEYNPSTAARPLVGIETPKSGPLKGAHTVDEGSKALLDAAEATRAYVDVQGATPWHFFSPKTPAKEMNAARVARDTNQPLTMGELERYREVGKEFGFGDVVDTGDGATFTNFGGDKVALTNKQARSMEQILGLKEGDVVRGRQEGNYLGLEDDWEQGVGSGAATKTTLERIDALPPATQAALDANVAIHRAAASRLAHTADLAGRYGPTRPDVDTALGIIAEGPGWISRLRAAVADGTILPAAAAAAMGSLGLQGGPSGSNGPQPAGGNGGT